MKLVNKFLIRLMFLCIVTVIVHAKKTKPATEYFNVCRRGDAKALNECVKQNLIDLRPQLKEGIKGLGLVPLDPLVVPRMELSQGVGTSFAVNLTLTDLNIHGMGEYTVNSVNLSLSDKENAWTDISLSAPELIMTSNYAMCGQILVLPIQGQGTCEMNFTDVTAIGHTVGRVVERNGSDYLEITSMKWEIKVLGLVRGWFYNLYNGDARLGNLTNQFLNDNGKDAFETYKNLPEEAFGEVFKGFAARVFNVYPIKELFLD